MSFTYDYARYAPSIQKYIHLYTGKPGETEIAVYCPTTLYRFGVNLHPTIVASYPLRDICEYDVLDELLINDGALKTKRYKALVLFQADIIDQPILKKIEAFQRAGGKVIMTGSTPIKNVEGQTWAHTSKVIRVAPLTQKEEWPLQVAAHLGGLKGFEGRLDGFWTSRRGPEVFVFNANENAAETKINGELVRMAPHTIYSGAREK